jgi:hypothetical protein
MSHSPAIDTSTSERDRAGRALVPTTAAVLVSTVALTVYGAHDMTEVVVVLAILLPVIGGVYGILLPRELTKESAGGTSLLLAVIGALLLVPAFWSGLPLALGAAGAMLGYAGRHASTGSGKCTVALILGTLASIGYFAVYALDTLSQMGVSWA